MAFTFVTVTADFDLANGLDPVGAVSFVPVEPMINGETVISAAVTRSLNVDGVLLIDIAANTDPATTTPSGDPAYYLVEEAIGGARRRYAVTIPHNAGPLVDLSGLTHTAVVESALPQPDATSSLPVVTYPIAGPPGPPGPVGPSGEVGSGITQVAADLRYVRVSEAPLSLTDPRVGAVLDGTGDQSAKVATAISLLPAAGGHIYQPPGILRTGAIAFDRAIRWEGAGENAAQIKAASGFTGTLVTVNAEFCSITDTQIDGGGSATAGLKVTRARCKFSRLHVNSMNGEGIWINGSAVPNSAHANQFSDIRVIDCTSRGVLVQGFAYDGEWINLWIGTCGTGLRIENTDNCFTNLHVWGSTGAGVEVRGLDNRFANVYVETNGTHGIDAFNSSRCRVTNGKIWKNQNQGYNISSSDRCLAMGLWIYDNGQNGVNGANSLHSKVIGCDFADDASSAQTQDRPIVTTGTSDKWIITDNTFLTAEHSTGANSLVGSNNVVANNVTT